MSVRWKKLATDELVMDDIDDEKAKVEPSLLGDVLNRMFESGFINEELLKASEHLRIAKTKKDVATSKKVLSPVKTKLEGVADLNYLTPDYLNLIITLTAPYGLFELRKMDLKQNPIRLGVKINGNVYQANIHSNDVVTNVDIISINKTMIVKADEMRLSNLQKMLTYCFSNEFEFSVWFDNRHYPIGGGNVVTVGLGDILRMKTISEYATNKIGGSVHNYKFRVQTIIDAGCLAYQSSEGSYNQLLAVIKYGIPNKDERRIDII